MLLTECIKQFGQAEIAKRVGVTERAVEAWRYRARRPRRETAIKIITEFPAVTWAGIYGPQTDDAA